ncbi:DUF155-domain-containing protein [Sarocladium strictum]
MDQSHVQSPSTPPGLSAPPNDENAPLLPRSPRSPTDQRPKPPRTVTFNPNPVTRTFESAPQSRPPHNVPAPVVSHAPTASSSSLGGPPMLAALNSKLRRRNSGPASANAAAGLPRALGPKQGPQRSTKKAEKLKLLPAPELDDEEQDEESGRDVYSQYTRIKDPTARRDAARLGKADRDRLPRVTAYCTANRYEMEGLSRFLKGRSKQRGANPKTIDECIYTPYNYAKPQRPDPIQSYERRHSTGGEPGVSEPDLIDLRNDPTHQDYSNEHQQNGYSDQTEAGQLHSDELLGPGPGGDESVAETIPDFDIQVHTPEVFLFDYGVVVIWGMSAVQEKRFLKEIAKFELEKLAADDVEVELFNFYYTREYQARIYNDFITLRDKNNYMTKLAISHALAQSVKTSLFEELIASTVETCKDLPTQIARTGKIALSRSEINMQIGELFILRINIHLNGSVLDTPELFWVEPQLEPVYQAVRSYLEMDQRVGLLTERLDVIADLLAVLKDQLSHGHGEKLEWIVIVLIAAEILVAVINIIVDLYAGE